MEIYHNWSFDNRSPLHWINQTGRMVACMLFACLPWPVLISLDQCWLILILILDPRLWSVFERCSGQIRSMLKGLDHFGTLESKWIGQDISDQTLSKEEPHPIIGVDSRSWLVPRVWCCLGAFVFSGTCLPFLRQIHADTISGKKEIYVRSTVSCCNKMVARKEYFIIQQEGKKNILVLLDIWPSSFYSVCYYRADTQNDYKCK